MSGNTEMDVYDISIYKLVLELSMIAFYLLCMIDQESLKNKQGDKLHVLYRRPRTVISYLIQMDRPLSA